MSDYATPTDQRYHYRGGPLRVRFVRWLAGRLGVFAGVEYRAAVCEARTDDRGVWHDGMAGVSHWVGTTRVEARPYWGASTRASRTKRRELRAAVGDFVKRDSRGEVAWPDDTKDAP